MSHIIESGYCTDYLISILIALFYDMTDHNSILLYKESNNPHTLYIQEMIMMKFIDPLHHNRMIESKTINRLRMILYNAGWLNLEDILTRASVRDFYTFLVSNLLNYNLEFAIIDMNRNETNFKTVRYIELDDTMISDGNISNGIVNWLKTNFKNDMIYSFKEVPQMIPVSIDSKKPVDLMEAIQFGSIGDKMQKILMWDIRSIICLDEKGYYSLVRNRDDWHYYRDGDIPSNHIISLNDRETVDKIQMEIKLCFYWGNF